MKRRFVFYRDRRGHRDDAVSDVGSNARPGHLRPSAARRRGAAELDYLLRRLCGTATQPAHADHACQRQEPRAEVDSAESGVRRVAVVADRRRRDDVRHAASQRRPGRGREDRPRVLAVPLHRLAGCARVLRREQSRRRDSRRHAVHGHARRAPRGDRRTTGRSLWDVAVGDPKLGYSITMAPLIVKDKVLVGIGRRRVRHPRLHRRLRREDRQGALALLHDSRTRGEGPRHVDGRLVEVRRRHRCG